MIFVGGFFDIRNGDLFLLAWFTGLAYSDIKALHALNIIVELDGSKHTYIPILTAAENIRQQRIAAIFTRMGWPGERN